MAISVDEFEKRLLSCGIVEKGAYRALTEKLDSTPEAAADVAKACVKAELLTLFQARMILAGKHSGLVLGNYEVQDKIGEGGMGQVYKAVHRRMERVVALKVLPAKYTKDKDAVKRFHREVRAAAKLSHPNIITAFDADEYKGVHFMVMEYVDGADLSNTLRAQGSLTVARAVDYIEQTAYGLQHAHENGIIHRDIKPANLLLDSSGVVKILDMGLARMELETGESITEAGSVMGTVDYMSPEQALDTKTADHRTDIYSLGCTLHFLLTGRILYPGDTLMAKMLAHRERPIPSLIQSRREVPDELDELYQRMVAKFPKERPQSMREVVESLAGVPIPTEAAAPPQRVVTGDLSDEENSLAATAMHDAPDEIDDLSDITHDPFAATVTHSDPPPPETVVSKQSSSASEPFAETIDSRTASGDSSPPAQTAAATADFPDFSSSIQSIIPRRERRGGMDKKAWAITGGVLASLAALLAVVVLSVKTRVGTIVLEIDQADVKGAVVTVDGNEKITIQELGKSDPIEVVADEKDHTLRVTKGGFEVFAEKFTVKSGESQTITVRLVPKADPTGESATEYALKFDGTDDYVEIPSINYSQLKAVTIEAWVRVDGMHDAGTESAHPRGVIVDCPAGSLDHRYFGKDVTDDSFFYATGPGASGSHADNDDKAKWHHVALCSNGQAFQFFVDGIRRSLAQAEGLLLDNVKGTFLGSSSRDGHRKYGFHGAIRELRISTNSRYSNQFTPEKKLEGDKTTLALYHFDEGDGRTLKDASGNDHHCIINGATWMKAEELTAKDYASERRVAEELLRRKFRVGVIDLEGRPASPHLGQPLPGNQFVIRSVEPAPDSALDNDALALIGKTKSLRILNSGGRSKVTRAAWAAQLPRLHRLQLLYLYNVQEIDESILSTLRPLQSLRLIDIGGTTINARSIGSLARLSSLTDLKLDYVQCPEGWSPILEKVKALPNLARLNLASTDVSDQHSTPLASLSKLKLLNLKTTKVTAAGVDTIRKALPNCRIEWDGGIVVPDNSPHRLIELDGEDDYVEIPAIRFNNIEEFTFEAFVELGRNATAEREQALFYSPAGVLVQSFHGNRKSAIYRAAGSHTSGGWQIEALSPNTNWKHHVAITAGRGQARLFVNGKLVKSQPIEKLAVNDKVPATWFGAGFAGGGSNKPNRFFRGRFNEIRISNTIRYTDNFIPPEQRFQPDEHTLALFHCDDPDGRRLEDASGNNNHGVVHGGRFVTTRDAAGRSNDAAIDRKAAESVLSRGGKVQLDGVRIELSRPAELPGQAFQLTGVSLRHHDW